MLSPALLLVLVVLVVLLLLLLLILFLLLEVLLLLLLLLGIPPGEGGELGRVTPTALPAAATSFRNLRLPRTATRAGSCRRGLPLLLPLPLPAVPLPQTLPLPLLPTAVASWRETVEKEAWAGDKSRSLELLALPSGVPNFDSEEDDDIVAASLVLSVSTWKSQR